MQNFRLLTDQVKFHQICTLIGSFYWKYIKLQLKTYRGIMSHVTEEWCKIWRKTDLLFQKWQEFIEFWSKHSKVYKICTAIGPFRAKYITFDQKKYRGVIFNDTEESCKVWRKNDLWFGKWHEEFGKFSSENLKVWKLVHSWDSFAQSRKHTSQKVMEELCVMTLKNDEKFEEEWTCRFKIDLRNLTNFDSSTRAL